MFRDFSFDPMARPAYVCDAERAAMNVSPTSQPTDRPSRYERPCTPPPCTVGDLAAQLNQQSLRIDSSCSSGRPWSRNECAILVDQHHQHEQQHHHHPRPTYSRVAASILRMQRQSNSRMQCSASHMRDISALVRMMADEEQCNVVDSKRRTWSSSSDSSIESTSTTHDQDEADGMDYSPAPQTIEVLLGQRSWQPNEKQDGCIRVTKTVRMRRRGGNGIQKRRSS